MSSKPNRSAAAAADRARRLAGGDVERLRLDSGVPRTRLAVEAGVDAGFLYRIERGMANASIDTYARLARVLGADLSLRLYPNTGPAIRDRHQGPILEALLAVRHARWHPYPEIAVRRPSRGWIDVGLHERRQAVFLATEIESDIRRLEQLIRWSGEKAASLPSWEGWTQLGDEPSISQLLLVRDTRANRSVARDVGRTLRAAYPAHPDDALEALTTATAAWPGPAILWATRGSRAQDPLRIVSRP